jgi:hypothetical protein
MKKILVSALLFLALNVCLAANHYIRQGATGNGSDWDNALAKMPDTQVRGDTYYIADGEYPILITGAPEQGTTPITIKKATIADHGTDTGWEDEYGDGYAKFVGEPGGGIVVAIQNGYTVIDGVTGGGPGSWDTGHGFWFHHNGGDETSIVYIREKSFNYVQLYGIELRHAKFTCPAESSNISAIKVCGIYTKQTVPMGAKFEYLYFKDLWGGNPYQSIGKEDILVQYCMVDGMKRMNAQHMEAYRTFPEQNCARHILRYNVWKNCVGSGLLILNGEDHQVYGNQFFWTEDKGTTLNEGLIATMQYGNARNVQIFNNTFVDIKASGFYGKGGNSGHVARNNLFVNCWPDARYPDQKGVAWSSAVAHTYNYYYQAGTHTEANVQHGTSNPFVKYAVWGGLNNDLHLAAATDGGYDYGTALNLDADGITRGQDGVWDRGAYEFDPNQMAILDFGLPIAGFTAHPLMGMPNPVDILTLMGIQKVNGALVYDMAGSPIAGNNKIRQGVYIIGLDGLARQITVK